MGVGWYILDEQRRPIPWDHSFYEWRQRVPESRWRVGLDHFGDVIQVSTVFLGLDHNYDEGSPILFETMVFLVDRDNRRDVDSQRYHTWEEAEAGHRAMCERVRAGEFADEMRAWVQGRQGHASGA